jgi:hypothetical protein
MKVISMLKDNKEIAELIAKWASFGSGDANPPSGPGKLLLRFARKGAGTVSSCRRFALDGDGRWIRKSITG